MPIAFAAIRIDSNERYECTVVWCVLGRKVIMWRTRKLAGRIRVHWSFSMQGFAHAQLRRALEEKGRATLVEDMLPRVNPDSVKIWHCFGILTLIIP